MTRDRRSHDVVRSLHAALQRDTAVAPPARLRTGEVLGSPGAFRFDLRTPSALRAMLLGGGDGGAGEAYVRGDVDIQGDVVHGGLLVTPLPAPNPAI